MDLLQSATPLLSALGLLALIVAGGFSVFGVFSKQRQTTNKEAKDDTDRLINLLKEQVNVLDKKVNEQELKIKDLTSKIELLISENRTLREVLQGRDEATKAYQQQGLKAFVTATQVLEIVSKTQDEVAKLTHGAEIEMVTTRKVKGV